MYHHTDDIMLCRLCLCSGGHMTDIYEENSKLEYMVKKTIEDLLQLKVAKESTYPWLVCTPCLDKLTEFRLFKRRCVECLYVFYKRVQKGHTPTTKLWITGQEKGALAGEYRDDVSTSEFNEDGESCTDEEQVFAWPNGSSTETAVPPDCLPRGGVNGDSSTSSTADAVGKLEFGDAGTVGPTDTIKVEVKEEVVDGVLESCHDDSTEDGKIAGEEESVEENVFHESRLSLEVQANGVDPRTAVNRSRVVSGESIDNGSTHGSEGVHESQVQGRCERKMPCWTSSPGGLQPLDTTLGEELTGIGCFGEMKAEDSRGVSASPLESSGPPYVCNDSGCEFTSERMITEHTECCDHVESGMRVEERGQVALSHEEDTFGTGQEASNESPSKHYECEVCRKVFLHRGSFDRHRATHSGVKPFTCPICFRSFRRRNYFNEHMSLHRGQMPHKCEVCSRAFGSKLNLQRHATVHTGERRFACSQCPKTFQRRSILLQHANTHSGVKPFPCRLCTKAFAQRINLETHMMLHTGDRPHVCRVCSKAFTTRDALRAHALVHSGNKPHACHLCPKTFQSSSELTRHMSIHTGEKPHSCNVCSKSFAQKGNLKAHMVVHLEERQFACPACPKVYKVQDSLRKHMEVHKT